MIYRSTQEEIQGYFNSPALGQSTLKTLLSGLDAYKNISTTPEKQLYYEEKGHFIIGSAVDCIITQGREVFNQLYITKDIEKPTDAVVSIIKQAFDTATEFLGNNIHNITEASFKEIVHNSINANSYYMNRAKINWLDDNRVEEVLVKKEGKKYWDALYSSIGKQILSNSETNIIDSIVNNWQSNWRTKNYFVDSKDIDMYYQLPIYFTYQGVDLKALPDMIIVNHTDKTIQIIDLKTMAGSTLGFWGSLKLRRYDIQAAMYKSAIINSFIADKKLDQFTVLPFRFIVESNTSPGNPQVYKLNEVTEWIGLSGVGGAWSTDDDGNETQYCKPIYGLIDCISRYLSYKEQIPEFSEDILTYNKQELELDWNMGIY